MECPNCATEMGDPVDTTYSNIKTGRADIGDHTGDIYWCEVCELRWLDDLLSDEIYVWQG